MQFLSASLSPLSASLLSSLAPEQGMPVSVEGEGFSALLDAQIADNIAQTATGEPAVDPLSAMAAFGIDPASPAILPASLASAPVHTTAHSTADPAATGTRQEAATGKSLPLLAGLPASAMPTAELAMHRPTQAAIALRQPDAQAVIALPTTVAQLPSELASTDSRPILLATSPTVAIHMAAAPLAESAPQTTMAQTTAAPSSANHQDNSGIAEKEAQNAPVVAAKLVVTPLLMQREVTSPKTEGTPVTPHTLEQDAPIASLSVAPRTARAARNEDAPATLQQAKLAAVSDSAALLPVQHEQAGAPAFASTAPATISQDTAARAATGPQVAAPMQDLTQILDRLTAAREALLPATAALAVQHDDFGPLSLRFDQSRDGKLTAELTAPDAETHRAVAQALAAEKSSPAGQDTFSRQNQDSSAPSAGRPSASERGDTQSHQQDQAASQARKNAAQRPSASAASRGSTPSNSGIFA